MNTPEITTKRQRELLQTLIGQVQNWSQREVQLKQERGNRLEEAKSRFEQDRQEILDDFEIQHGSLLASYKKAREGLLFTYSSTSHQLTKDESELIEQKSDAYHEAVDEGKSLWHHRREMIQSQFHEHEPLPHQECAQFEQLCAQREAEVQAIVNEARTLVSKRCTWPETVAPPPAVSPGLPKLAYIEQAGVATGNARIKLYQLSQLPAARFLEDGWPFLIFLFSLVAFAYPAWRYLMPNGILAVVGACLGGSALLAVALRQIMRPFSRMQTLRLLPEFQLNVAQAEAYLSAAVQSAQAEAARKVKQLTEHRDRDLASVSAEWKRQRESMAVQHESTITQIEADFRIKRHTLDQGHERQMQQLEDRFPPQIREREELFRKQRQEQKNAYLAVRQQISQEFSAAWEELSSEWKAGIGEFQAALDEMNAVCDANFPNWESIDWKSWRPRPQAVANAESSESAEGETALSEVRALRFGEYAFDLQKPAECTSAIVPADSPAGLPLPEAPYRLPAVISFPESPSLLLEAEGEGRDSATQLMQDVMLRLLTTFPPAKVRFTIIDPVGLGQNFSAFMHLADFDERLVNNRIWTEANHIQQRLADLTEHMENVIQKYLRNEFASILDYNKHAGEVAEPFQILVVANFPANFSDEAARRLVSIASSGARCGVYTLISTDNKLKLPRNFDMADLQSQATNLVWDVEQGRFRWQYEDLAKLPLAVETPPADEPFTQAVQAVGKLAKDASRVEVPFSSVIPASKDWWKSDSRVEIEVPLGRAGATKLQIMRLGKGTSQHVLIAGKTGSGKSTLLNAMITNLAIHYSPEELQFYLIDFKKGVEFKAYAACKLPHARVIAIESEREFGMSVLERLDQELKRRGDLLRQQGVQDVKGYRNANPTATLPRILLIIDEFQEFFTTDDKISHDAGLLLDRLVRQGRAFGIHVLLGSQTLAGAYSLARSTIGQMAVRIALQCSESDAHLILSEDNTAARLLSRPGEAIYNDANGMFEGNHPFQVVWLSDQQREKHLHQLADMAQDREVALPPPFIFEGNVAADPAGNPLLRSLVESSPSAVAPMEMRGWLGAAVAIKDPTEVVFRRQSGSNVLIVGQQEELALGMFSSLLISLASQLPRPAEEASKHHPSLLILDGSRPETGLAGFWSTALPPLGVEARVVRPTGAAEVVRTLAAEVDARVAAGDQGKEPIFVFVHGLSRFRDLKKSDDFGISGFGEEGSGSVDKQWANILKEGPAVGVHAIVWVDSYSNTTRWLERSTMRDFDLRVLFQMSATDSSNLMESPAASKLGVQLAILYSEEQVLAEKFRPYGLPAEGWLNWVHQQLHSRPASLLARREVE